MKNWTKNEIDELIRLYPDNSYYEISKLMNKTIMQIQTKSYNMNLSKKYGKKLYTNWTKDEIDKLKKLYPNMKNLDISKSLNKNERQISYKARILKLSKSKEHLKKIGIENSILDGKRELTFDVLKDVASNYNTRGDLQLNDPSVYRVALINGHLDNICSHMIKQNYSTPQLILKYLILKIIDNNILYNDRKIIKPYEIDIYLPKYKLAFEYDGKRWHNNNDKDIIKNNLCIKKDIFLIRIKENSRNYILDIKNQLINNIDIINNWCNLNIKKQDILSINKNEIYKNINKYILNDDNIYNIVKKYHNYFDFIKNEPNLYVKLIRNNCLDKYTSKLKRSRKKWTMESIKIEISKYKTLKDFTKKSNPCYQYVKRHELDFLIKELDKY